MQLLGRLADGARARHRIEVDIRARWREHAWLSGEGSERAVTSGLAELPRPGAPRPHARRLALLQLASPYALGAA